MWPQVSALAAPGGRDLDAEGISVVPMGGATKIWRFLDLLGNQRCHPFIWTKTADEILPKVRSTLATDH